MLEIVVVHCSVFCLNEALKETEKKISDLIGWAHAAADEPSQLEISKFSSKESKSKMKKKLDEWFYFNNHVKENGPSSALKVIRHGSQVYYSKVKTGVDGLSKQAAIIRSPTIKLDFEKIILATICQSYFTMLTSHGKFII